MHFAVWAPNAARVSVIGDFNGWDGRVHPMRLLAPYSPSFEGVDVAGLKAKAGLAFEAYRKDSRRTFEPAKVPRLVVSS